LRRLLNNQFGCRSARRARSVEKIESRLAGAPTGKELGQ
jgi:hypothetical protein